MKGKIRKLLSVVVATAMTLSCLSVPALADPADGGTSDGASDDSSAITLTDEMKAANGHYYEVFQVLTGTIDTNGSITNAQWGSSAMAYQEGGKNSVDDAILKSLNETANASSGYSQYTVAQTVYSYIDASKPYTTNAPQLVGSEYVYSNVPAGYYLIKDIANTQNGQGGSYTLYCVKVTSGNLTFTPKGNTPTVEKTVTKVGGATTETDVDNVSASIGDTLTYTIEGEYSNQIENFQTYYYEFSDTISEALKVDEASIKIYFGTQDADHDITQYFWNNAASPENNNDGTYTYRFAIQDLKLLSHVDSTKFAMTAANSASTKIILTYNAKLNEKAKVGEKNSNKVDLIYSNDPNNSGTPAGDDDKPSTNPGEPTKPTPTGGATDQVADVYTAAVQITKKSLVTDQILTGAEFTLVNEGTGTAMKMVNVTEFNYSLVESATVDTSTGKDAADNDVYVKRLSDGEFVTLASLGSYDAINGATKKLYDCVTEGNFNYYIQSTKTTLKGVNCTETEVKGEVDANGVVTFTGLGAGTYVLKETKAPDGYTAHEDVTFTIAFNKDTLTFSSGRNDTNMTNNGVIEYTVKDAMANMNLPTTGGIGTTIFYVAGTILVLGAAVALITRRRMKGEVK
jgi:fimbrial isopeptide formation D2 family protein/LPXTG-motif cell wall-anchored protein